MKPNRTASIRGSAVVRGFELSFSPLGRALGPDLAGASMELDLSCVLVTKIRKNERNAPTDIGTIKGKLSSNTDGVLLSVDDPVENAADLTETFEQDGHRRPRRKLFLALPDGTEQPLLLPDAMQVDSGHMEVQAKLIVLGEVHADVTQNDVLDVPLLPLEATHAVFHFIDSMGEPLAGMTARFSSSDGTELEATTDDFGEVFLDASKQQVYTLLETLPADERLAVVETDLTGPGTALA